MLTLLARIAAEGRLLRTQFGASTTPAALRRDV